MNAESYFEGNANVTDFSLRVKEEKVLGKNGCKFMNEKRAEMQNSGCNYQRATAAILYYRRHTAQELMSDLVVSCTALPKKLC